MDPTGISGSTVLTVTSAVLVWIAISPAASMLADGTTEQLTATGTYSDSSTRDLTSSVTWSSSAPDVFSISNSTGSAGLGTGLAYGSAAISARDRPRRSTGRPR